MVKSGLLTASLLLTTLLLSTLAGAHEAAGGAHEDAAIVDSVVAGGPAAIAGLQVGDRILRVGDRRLASESDLSQIVAAYQPGDTVPLTVQRNGETVELSLTFGERPEGGISIGVALQLMSMQLGDDDPHSTSGGPDAGTIECLAWIDKTYRIESTTRELGLEVLEEYEAIRKCVARDTQRMTNANAVRYCDNVFKVHCSALDLLTEIGEAQVQRCEERLAASLGLSLKQHDGWRKCGQNKVFDRYSMDGASSDDEMCKAALLDECGTNIDPALQKSELSPDQREFVGCCSTDAIDPSQCPMIDDGFERGPCHDRSVCVNRLTNEWVSCSGLE
jgi:hypothetical protein